MYRVGCVIPAGTKTLTLRTTDVEGDNYLDYCDWIEPTLYEKAPSAGVIKDLYTDYNATPNTVLSAEGAIGVRFNVKEAFSEITVKKEFSETDVVGLTLRIQIFVWPLASEQTCCYHYRA